MGYRLIQAFRARLGVDSERSGLRRSTAEWLFLAPLAGAVVVAGLRVSRGVFKLLTAEDRILEWAQFAGYTLPAVVAFVVAFRLARGRRWLVAGAWLFLAVGCTFVAGEEISWGQRIFHWKTPGFLGRANHQDELNIHNVRSVQDGLNAALMMGALYGAVVPWFFRGRRDKPAHETANLFLPALFLSSAFLVMFAYKALRFAVLPEPRYTIVKFGEYPEFCFAYALAVFTVLTHRALRRESPVARAAAASSISR